MIIGESVVTETIFYTLWFERQGDAATFMVDNIAFMANAQADVEVENKNKDEADSSAVTATGGTFTTISSTGVHTKRATSLLELVRLKVEVTDSAEGDSWMHLRIVEPAWETN
ncbi:MAG: hypothetical protein ACYTG5_07015 [Planctomycetota bacterium]|jgi:hypothetical protein